MKNFYFLMLIAAFLWNYCSLAAQIYPPAGENYLTVDLQNTASPGGVIVPDTVWQAKSVTAQGVTFTNIGDEYVWAGFTLSTMTDNSNHNAANDWFSGFNQFCSMTQGGYDGKGTPYLTGYYSEWDFWNAETFEGLGSVVDISHCGFNMPQGVFITSSSYTYYVVKEGNAFAKKFEKGDYLKITARGYLKEDIRNFEIYTDLNSITPTGKSEYMLADFSGEELVQPADWQWWDLTTLGKADCILFTVESTDVGEWGTNTPAYFCLDKLTLKKENGKIRTSNSVGDAYRCGNRICNIPEGAFISIYNLNGTPVTDEKAKYSEYTLPNNKFYITRIISSAGVQILK